MERMGRRSCLTRSTDGEVMLGIRSQVWAFRNANGGERRSVRDILEGPHTRVRSFSQLVRRVAELSYHNPEHVLFYRGQPREYTKKAKDGTKVPSFYPTIFRSPGRPLTKDELARRYSALDNASERLLDCFAEEGFTGHAKLRKFPELAWSILQHYEVCATPLLDVTHSLRVAASFALNTGDSDGYLYVFGLPHPNGSITYSADLETINIRLLSICPPEAQRPYFQEGFLVGSMPVRQAKREPSLDVGRRIMAKFVLTRETFWTEDFSHIPDAALYPTHDKMLSVCGQIRRDLDFENRLNAVQSAKG